MIKIHHYTTAARIKKTAVALLTLVGLCAQGQELKHGSIDRKLLVSRHNLRITDRNLQGPAQVGNGHFAYGFDITGLQTFSAEANTMSDWGWHKFPEPKGQTPADFKGQTWDTQGRMVRYDLDNPAQPELTDWMVANPQRLNLGRFGFILKKKDGTSVALQTLENPVQELNLWTGVATSTFTVDGKPVKVITVAHPGEDAIAIHVEAPGLNDGQIGFFLEFPFASLEQFGNGADWNNPNKHQTRATFTRNSAHFRRTLDATNYEADLTWENGAKIKETKLHRYELMPANTNQVNIVLRFSKQPVKTPVPTYSQVKKYSETHWAEFWNSGGAIDLSGSKDPR